MAADDETRGTRNRGIADGSRMTLDANRGLAVAPTRPGAGGGASTTASRITAPGTRYLTTFYDRVELRYLDRWARVQPRPMLYLIDPGLYDTIRSNQLKREQVATLTERFIPSILRESASTQTLRAPPFSQSSPPWLPQDWDDQMIDELAKNATPLTIQSEADQWKTIDSLFKKAIDDAKAVAGTNKPAREFAAYFALEVIAGTLRIVEAQNVTMSRPNHADVPYFTLRDSTKHVMPGDPGTRVIGDIHTHFHLDPLINTGSTTLGATIASQHDVMHQGVSDVDVQSATSMAVVVNAVDSKYLHRANPNGTKNDKLPRSGDVLREALRIFAREPS